MAQNKPSKQPAHFSFFVFPNSFLAMQLRSEITEEDESVVDGTAAPLVDSNANPARTPILGTNSNFRRIEESFTTEDAKVTKKTNQEARKTASLPPAFLRS